MDMFPPCFVWTAPSRLLPPGRAVREEAGVPERGGHQLADLQLRKWRQVQGGDPRPLNAL